MHVLSLITLSVISTCNSLSLPGKPGGRPGISRQNPITVNITAPNAQDIITSIVGGSTIGAKPWMISLGYVNGNTYNHYCGGTLISANYVLTAAHCVYETSAVGDTIYIGGADLRKLSTFRKFKVASQRIHPQYIFDTNSNDIAILKLDKPYNGATFITLNQDYKNEAAGKTSTVMGWGVMTSAEGAPVSNLLRQVSLPLVSTVKCNSVYDNLNYPYPIIAKYHLCAGGKANKDSCQGDSGGPLLVTSGSSVIQVGVVSFGEGCGNAGIPGVYARMSSYVSWIKSLGIPVKTTVLATTTNLS